jgi:hypothetical protein
MNVLPRENRGVCRQIRIFIAAFQQNGFARAFILVRPVLLRRIKEVADLCVSPLKYYSSRQRHIRGFVARKLKKIGGPQPNTLGNYAAFTALLSRESAVYSFGIGGDIRFDIALTEAISCTVHLFDPTPRSARFMANHSGNQLLQFHPWGLWIADQRARFLSDVTLIIDPRGSVVQDYRSGSLTNITNSGTWFEGECLTLPSIMQRLEHRHIDLLKMDIEGAALEVTEHLLETNMRPSQIIAEFEAPHENSELGKFLCRVEGVIDQLKSDGYTLCALDRGTLHIESIELLAARL